MSSIGLQRHHLQVHIQVFPIGPDRDRFLPNYLTAPLRSIYRISEVRHHAFAGHLQNVETGFPRCRLEEGTCASAKLDNLQLTVHDDAGGRVLCQQDPVRLLENFRFRDVTPNWSIDCRLANLPFSNIPRRKIKGPTGDHGLPGIDLEALVSHLEDVVELTYSLEVSQDKESRRLERVVENWEQLLL